MSAAVKGTLILKRDHFVILFLLEVDGKPNGGSHRDDGPVFLCEAGEHVMASHLDLKRIKYSTNINNTLAVHVIENEIFAPYNIRGQLVSYTKKLLMTPTTPSCRKLMAQKEFGLLRVNGAIFKVVPKWGHSIFMSPQIIQMFLQINKISLIFTLLYIGRQSFE